MPHVPPPHGRIVGAVAARVVKVADHPNGNWIWLAWIDLGNGEPPAQIVFGGRVKVKVGDLVPVAPPGARLHQHDSDQAARPKKVRKRRFRGEMSHGMLCSLDELGWLPGGPDEVALLRLVDPGDRLDTISNHRLPLIVIGWARAVETALGSMVDDALESTPDDATS